MTKIKPVGARVLVQKDPAKTTQGGLYLPESAQEEPKRGTVVALGSDVDAELKVGDQVYFSPYAGNEVTVASETNYLILPQDEILCVCN